MKTLTKRRSYFERIKTRGKQLATIQQDLGIEALILVCFYFLELQIEDSSFIYWAPIIYVDGFFYVFGGYPYSSHGTTINKLDAATHVWSKAGDLNTSRFAHNVIFDGRHFLVIGGAGTKQTERCTTRQGEMTCVEQAPKFKNYAWYPELFLVPDNFCKKSP